MTYQATIIDALKSLYTNVITFLPNLVIALIVLIVGWLIGIFLGKLIQKILVTIRIDSLANQLGLENLSEKAGKKLSLANFGGWLIKWFFFLGSFMAAADVLNLNQVSQFLYDRVLPFAGNVVAAVAILLLGIIAANFLSNIVQTTVKTSGLHTASNLGSVTKWAVLIFTVYIALGQLQIKTNILDDLVRAVLIMVAIAGGIAFGLGGKEHAKQVLDNVEKDLTGKI